MAKQPQPSASPARIALLAAIALILLHACGVPATGGSLLLGPRDGSGASPTGGGGTGGGSSETVPGSGGQSGAPGSTVPGKLDPAKLPCDIYALDGGPCVAAHSTIRRLSSGYTGPLYQVRSGGSKAGTGGALTDIPMDADGFADGAAHQAACGSGPCTLAIIYDQSGQGNHLTHAPSGGAKRTPGNEADANALPVTLAGRRLYAEHSPPGVAYRNNHATGTATGDNPETIYMVTSGDDFNMGCCFDYGNAETNSMNNGEGTVEAVYFGACTIWGKGAGNGPWVMADLENGLWPGSVSPNEHNPSLSYRLVTAMVKGDSAGKNHWAIKAGNAQEGPLAKVFDGRRPSARYNPMRKEGAITLGAAGDNSNGGQGNFFEGVMTAHFSSDAADEAVQANIASVYGQYGR